jgi:hypothetical protein
VLSWRDEKELEAERYEEKLQAGMGRKAISVQEKVPDMLPVQ